ncbi:MAG: PH domain-containing protein [Alphaproteobacteria bacterium]
MVSASYLETTLSSGESVLYKARVHWIVFVGPIWAIVFGAALVAVSTVFGGVLLFLGILGVAMAFVQRATTDLAVTNKKIISKTGLLARHSSEQRLDKVESIHVDQGLIGRLLDYGNITVVGSGSSGTPIQSISQPVAFRRAVDEAIDQLRKS